MICEICHLKIPVGNEQEHTEYHLGIIVQIETIRRELDALEVVDAP